MDSSELVMAEENLREEAEERFEYAEEEDDDSSPSDSEIGDLVDWLDSKDDGESFDSLIFAPNYRCPDANGGLHSHPNSPTLLPRSNRRRNPSPLHELEGKLGFGVSNLAVNGIRGYIKTIGTGKTRNKDKADRATLQGVLDQPTILVIDKFMKNGELGIFSEYSIWTGKEANVYYAQKSDGQERAVKVYRTSILEYKDRARFLEGGHRFQRRCNVHNPRKMVEAWAFKEMRNLLRLKKEGILCPNPCGLKRNVLVMNFIGKDGWAAPRLNDANLSLSKLREGYVEIIIAMRKMHQKCKLVHGDLSEYNILSHELMDHPRADEFLREDCVHVSEFFEKNGVAVMTVDDLFNFISHTAGKDMDSHLEKIQQRIELLDTSAEEKTSDSVLIQVDEDINDMYNTSTTGLNQALSQAPVGLTEQQEDSGSNSVEEPELETSVNFNPAETESESSEEEEEDYSSDEDLEGNCSPETEGTVDRKAARKENKRRVKEEKRESRKHKLAKAVRKRRKKLTKNR